jgi:methyl-accepting chemotaxis protein
MECHSVPSAAPAAMIKLYGGNNGFGWKLNEIVAAQIVSVPMAIPNAIAEGALRSLMVWMGTISLLSLLLLNVVLIVAIVRPVKRLSVAADEISKGNLNVPELEVKGSDEVSVLADSFNRMHRSLVKAIKMLEE